jgi:phage portal protein BeeE
MGLFGIFRSRDKPKNGTSGSAYPFMWGYSASGKRVNERTSMQMTAVYSCVRILSDDCVIIVINQRSPVKTRDREVESISLTGIDAA